MVFFIVNPASKSGQGIVIWRKVRSYLTDNQIAFKAFKTTKEKDATFYVQKLASKFPSNQYNPLKIFILGGDGTINEAIQGIPDDEFDRILLGYIPTGSSNDLARALDYEKDPVATCRHLLDSNASKLIDLGYLEYNDSENPWYKKRKFIVSSGIGYDAAVCAEANNSELKKKLNKYKLGKLSYFAICLKQLFTTPKIAARITAYDATEKHIIAMEQCYFVATMNHCYQGGGIKFCPDAVNNDGILDICYAKDISPFRVLMTLPMAFSGKHIGMKGIGNFRCKKLRIEFDEPMWVHTDGEVKTKASDITITCLPEKLRFIV